MENDTVIFERTPYKTGENSIALSIPQELAAYLEIEYDADGKPTTPIKLMPDKSKHGKYIGLWNPKQQAK
jgi:hypothetical protein